MTPGGVAWIRRDDIEKFRARDVDRPGMPPDGSS